MFSRFHKGVAGLVLVALATVAQVSFGLDLKPSEIRGKKRKHSVSVLQNRFFEKTFRPEIGLMSGVFINEAYVNTATRGVRLGMFFTEWVGLEFQYSDTSVTDTEDRKALTSLEYYEIGEEGDAVVDKKVHPDPEVNPVSKIQDMNAVFAPFYGKLNLFDSLIVYTDLYITTGISKVATTQGELQAFSVGAGQRIYLFESLSLRLDFRDRIYNELRRGVESTRHALGVDLGASFFFN